jgi:hypothetical protein
MESIYGRCTQDPHTDAYELSEFDAGMAVAYLAVTRLDNGTNSAVLTEAQLREIRDWINEKLGDDGRKIVVWEDPAQEMHRLRTVLAAKERECEELARDYQEMATNFEAADREIERLREFGKQAMAADLRKPRVTGTPHGLAGELQSIHFTGDGTHVTMTFEVKGAA